MDGRTDGRMMISGEEGGNTFTHTHREEEQGREGSGGTYLSIST